MIEENDKPYETLVISGVSGVSRGGVPEGWTIHTEEGWVFFVENHICDTIPSMGERADLYEKGLGHAIRGIVIEGRVYRYRTEAEQKAKNEKEFEALLRKKAEEDAAFRAGPKPPLDTFEVRDPALWANLVETNIEDPYGYAALRYAARWAALMEYEMSEGRKGQEMIDRTSHEADLEGITGFMQNFARRVLVSCWALREEAGL
jgi:hypothetical protein